MKINCLSCGHKVELDDVYDDFEGQVKCFACTALLEIRTEEGSSKASGSWNAGPPGPRLRR